MNQTERTVQVLALAVAPDRRARFIEEWQADVAAARTIGLSPAQILLAAARVAGFLLVVRVRTRATRERGPVELIAAGAALGLLLVVADVPLDLFAPVVLPFLLLMCGRRLVHALLAWVSSGS